MISHQARIIVVFLITISLCSFLKTSYATEQEKNVEIEHAETGTIWDRYHTYLTESVNKPVIWFDSFFGDLRADDVDLPESFVRLRSSVRFTEGDGLTFPVRVRAKIRLPKASKRLRLILVGENEKEIEAAQTTGSTVPGITPQEPDNTTNVGLRYSVYKTLRTKLHFGGGLRLRSPLEYYLRVKYQRLIHIGSKNIIRLTQIGFWHSEDKLGETSRLDFERSFSETLSNRFSMFGTYSEVSEGLEWGIEESLFKQLTAKSALSLDLGAYGETRPHTEVNIYRIGSRFRKNILRPWLFFEIEPEVTFPLDDYGKRHAVGAITFVIEVQFAGEKLDIK